MLGNKKDEKKLNIKKEELQSYDLNNVYQYSFEYTVEPIKSSTEYMNKKYEESIERIKKFEDKAKTNLLAISISVSVMFGLISPILNIYSKYPNYKIFLFIIGMLIIFFMLYGGLLSLNVLMEKNVVYQLRFCTENMPKVTIKKYYTMYTELNEISNTIRNNYINTSYKCIRNALILLMMVFTIGILPIHLEVESKIEKQYQALLEKVDVLEEKNDKSTSLINDKLDELNKEHLLYETELYVIEKEYTKVSKKIQIENSVKKQIATKLLDVFQDAEIANIVDLPIESISRLRK